MMLGTEKSDDEDSRARCLRGQRTLNGRSGQAGGRLVPGPGGSGEQSSTWDAGGLEGRTHEVEGNGWGGLTMSNVVDSEPG